LFGQFDFALDEISKFATEMFAVNIVGFTPTFVESSSLTPSYKFLIKPRFIFLEG